MMNPSTLYSALILVIVQMNWSCGQSGRDSRGAYQVKTQSSDLSKDQATVSFNLTNPSLLLEALPDAAINAYLLTLTPEESCPEDFHSVLGWFTKKNQISVSISLSSQCNISADLQYGYQLNSQKSEAYDSDTGTVSNALTETFYRSSKPVLLSTGALSRIRTSSVIFNLDLTNEGRQKGYKTARIISDDAPAGASDKNVPVVGFDQAGPLLTSANKGNCARSGCHDGAGKLKRYLDPEDFKQSEKGILKRVVELKNMPPNADELNDSERQIIASWVRGGFQAISSDPVNEETRNEKRPDNNEGNAKEDEDTSTGNTPVTFKDVEGLLLGPGKGDCARAGCHAQGGSLRPMSNFDELKEAGTGILSRVINLKNMPPNPSELNDKDRELIQAWLTDGSLP